MLGNSLNKVGFPHDDRALAPAPLQDLTRLYSRGDGLGEAVAEGSFDVRWYIRILLRHWLLIVAAVVVALGAGVGSLLLRQPIYTATVTLQIDKESQNQVIDAPGSSGAEVIQSEEFFQTQYGLLRSRSLAQRTLEKLEVARDPGTLLRIGVEPVAKSSNSTNLQRTLLNTFQKQLSIQPVRGSRLVNISYDSRDPTTSARIANAVADNFIALNIERRFEASSYNRNFLADQLSKEKSKLEDAERQLAAYAKSQQLINIPGGDGKDGSSSANQSLTASTLMALNNALAEARGERIQAEARWRHAQATPARNLTEVLSSETVQRLKDSQAKLQADYEDKLRILKPDMPEMQQLQARMTENQRQVEAETNNIKNSLLGQYETALNAERQFEGQVAQLKASVLDLRDRSINYDILQREVDTSRQLYEGLLQKYREVGVAGNLRTNNIFIVDRAEPPASPSKPKPLTTMVIALCAGLLMGVALAFLMELLDESIRSPEDVERKLGMPLLGTVPKLGKNETPAEALANIRSAFAEAYYSVRTALQFSTNEGAPSSLLVTSARPAEGKSTSARAIAMNFARLGQRVLLVDCDLRNPSLHKAFRAENSSGISNFLTGGAPLKQLVRMTDTPNLYFIPSGPLPPSPAELLASDRVQEMLNEARASFDIFVIDGPPVMGLADAPMLASIVAGSVLVVESGGTGRNLAQASLRRLSVGRARVLGVLLTKFDAKKNSYGYGYGHGYSYAYDYNYGPQPALKDK